MNTETALVVKSIINKKHTSLAEIFVANVINQLHAPFKIKKYGVESDWRETETAELEFEDDVRLIISVVRKIS